MGKIRLIERYVSSDLCADNELTEEKWRSLLYICCNLFIVEIIRNGI